MFPLSFDLFCSTLPNLNPGLQRREGKSPPPPDPQENFRSVHLKGERKQECSHQKDHTYNLRGNHTHRIAEAVNLAPGAGGRGKGKSRARLEREPEKASPPPTPGCRSLGAPAATSRDRSPAVPSLPTPTPPGDPQSRGRQVSRARPSARLCRPGRVPARRREPSQGRAAGRCPGPGQPGWPVAGPRSPATRGRGKLRKSGPPRRGARMLRDPPRPPGARTQRQPQPRGRTTPPAHSPRPGAAVFFPPSPARSEHGVPTRGSAPMAGEGRRARSPPGAGARREAPRAEAEVGGRSAAHRGPPSPARLGSESPSEPFGPPRAEKVTWGRREGRARRGVGTGLALASCSAVRRRLRAGGSRSPGLPRPPLQEARRLRGAAAGPTPRLRARGANLVLASLPRGGGGRCSSSGHLG